MDSRILIPKEMVLKIFMRVKLRFTLQPCNSKHVSKG